MRNTAWEKIRSRGREYVEQQIPLPVFIPTPGPFNAGLSTRLNSFVLHPGIPVSKAGEAQPPPVNITATIYIVLPKGKRGKRDFRMVAIEIDEIPLLEPTF
jgi:hypothetical protein